jgi:predicted Zn-dependent peptidase
MINHYKNDKFNVKIFKIIFYKKIKKEDITNLLLLEHMIFNGNLTFPGKRLLNRAKIEKNIIQCYSNVSFNTEKIFFEITIKHTNNDYDQIITFLESLLFEVDFSSTKTFDSGVNLLEQRMKIIKENQSFYGLIRTLEEMMPNTNYSLRPTGYKEDLEKITDHSLKLFHDDFFSNAYYQIFSIDENETLKLNFKKLNTNNNILIKEEINHSLEFKSATKYVEEKIDKKQSNLFIGYKIKSATPYEREILFPIWNIIYGAGADGKLFKAIREKNSLCYSIRSKFIKNKNMIIVGSGLDKENIEKAITLIDKEFENMKNHIEDEELDIAKKMMIKELQDTNDSIDSYLNMQVLEKMNFVYNEKEKIDLIEKIDKQEIYNLFPKIVKDTIFHLKGDTNEKN